MQIYKLADFEEWADDEGLTNAVLIKTIKEIEQGLIDANLGGGLYKKRIAREGQGKSSGYRTLIAFKKEDRALFVYGFSKNKQDNISIQEKETFKDVARYYLNLSDVELMALVKKNFLVEVN